MSTNLAKNLLADNTCLDCKWCEVKYDKIEGFPKAFYDCIGKDGIYHFSETMYNGPISSERLTELMLCEDFEESALSKYYREQGTDSRWKSI